jgi:hypothetical protein
MRSPYVMLGLVGMVAIPLSLLTRGKQAGRELAPIQAALPVGVLEWTLTAKSGGSFEVVQKASVESGAPYFESVRLDRTAGATRTVCHQFGRPILQDTGANRYWVYAVARAASGACAAVQGGAVMAVGVRGTVETLSNTVP